MSRRNLSIIRWGVFLAACGFLFLRSMGYQGMDPGWADWREALDRVPWSVFGLVGSMVALNWGLEAGKWWWLMRPVQKLSYGRAYLATLVGTTVGLITPNRIGEFAGRVLFLDPEHRVQGGFATLLGSIAQFVVTLTVGGFALAFGPRFSLMEGPLIQVLVWSMLLIGCTAIFLYFSPGMLGRLLTALPFLDRFERQARILGSFGMRQLLIVFMLSLARYMVFTFQFALLLQVIADIPLGTGLLSVPVVFLVTTLVPTTALTELGVRGSAATALLPGDASTIVLASALIWAVNVVAPALIGGIVLLVARIRTNDHG